MITNKIHQKTLIIGITLFFPSEFDRLCCSKLSQEIQRKIVSFYGISYGYSLRSRDVHSMPSCHKWSDFEYRP